MSPVLASSFLIEGDDTAMAAFSGECGEAMAAATVPDCGGLGVVGAWADLDGAEEKGQRCELHDLLERCSACDDNGGTGGDKLCVPLVPPPPGTRRSVTKVMPFS